MKIDRMIYILLALLNKEQVTAVELAEHFQVSARTIYRDIEALNMAGVPIYSQQGAGGGFSILRNYKLDKQLLKEEEASSIITALKAMTTTVDDIGLNNIIEKITAITKPSKEVSRKELILDFSPWGSSKKHKGKLDMIKRAIEENKVLSFKYTDYNSVNTQRVVEPVNLIFKGYSWYLYAYCRSKESTRIFRLSRMMDLEMLEEVYQLREELLIKKDEITMWMNNLSTNTHTIKLKMKFSPNVRVKVLDYFDEEQIEIMSEGYIKVETVYPDDEWIYGFILSFGADVEVLEPQYIRDIIKEKSKRIYDIYK